MKKICILLLLCMSVFCMTLTGCGVQKAGDVRANLSPIKPEYKKTDTGEVTVIGPAVDIPVEAQDPEDPEDETKEDVWYEEIHLISDDTHFVYWDKHTQSFKVFKLGEENILGLTEYIKCEDEEEAEKIFEFYDKVDKYKFKDATVREYYIKENYIVIDYKYIAWTGITLDNMDKLYGETKINNEEDLKQYEEQ